MLTYTAFEFVKQKLDNLDGRLNALMAGVYVDVADDLEEIEARVEAMFHLAIEKPELAGQVDYLHKKVKLIQQLIRESA